MENCIWIENINGKVDWKTVVDVLRPLIEVKYNVYIQDVGIATEIWFYPIDAEELGQNRLVELTPDEWERIYFDRVEDIRKGEFLENLWEKVEELDDLDRERIIDLVDRNVHPERYEKEDF